MFQHVSRKTAEGEGVGLGVMQSAAHRKNNWLTMCVCVLHVSETCQPLISAPHASWAKSRSVITQEVLG